MWRSRTSAASVALLAALLWAAPAAAGAPEWLKSVAREKLPEYSGSPDAVLLLDERTVTVKDSGDMKVVVRRAYRILRPGGREHGTMAVYFDSETKLTFLKGWSLTAAGTENEVKEKEAIETTPFQGVLYQDTRLKILSIPTAEPGNVVGYEYEQKKRPHLLQDSFSFADTIPVRRARYALELPEGWEFETYWLNYAEPAPVQSGGNRWAWELNDVAAIEVEPAMPPWQAVAGRLAVSFFPRREGLRGKSHGSWQEVGRWYDALSRDRRASNAEIRAKVGELTAGVATPMEKIAALARFAQRDIRYVAISIGIGGHQPHAAREVFLNRYGDCKDKATLLAAMLSEVGVESHYVLIHTQRGVVAPAAPSAYSFNHAILAIRLPPEADTGRLYSTGAHERLGTLLYFDPTDDSTPLGQLPSYLQANHGLLVSDEGGELVQLPLQPPSTNRLLRTAKLSLSSTGGLTGQVQEVRWGRPGIELRSVLLAATTDERPKVLESYLANFLSGFTLTQSEVGNLNKPDDTLIVHYRFHSRQYAKLVGNLLLVRPRVLGSKGSGLMEKKERKYPVEFDEATLQSDIYEIELPAGYAVDELPPPVEAVTDFAEYRSQMEVEGSLLRYKRTYIIKQVQVPVERLAELKDFYRRVAADERGQAVLKKIE